MLQRHCRLSLAELTEKLHTRAIHFSDLVVNPCISSAHSWAESPAWKMQMSMPAVWRAPATRTYCAGKITHMMTFLSKSRTWSHTIGSICCNLGDPQSKNLRHSSSSGIGLSGETIFRRSAGFFLKNCSTSVTAVCWRTKITHLIRQFFLKSLILCFQSPAMSILSIYWNPKQSVSRLSACSFHICYATLPFSRTVMSPL